MLTRKGLCVLHSWPALGDLAIASYKEAREMWTISRPGRRGNRGSFCISSRRQPISSMAVYGVLISTLVEARQCHRKICESPLELKGVERLIKNAVGLSVG